MLVVQIARDLKESPSPEMIMRITFHLFSMPQLEIDQIDFLTWKQAQNITTESISGDFRG